ncbi:MAG: hypothetical protein K8T25_01145 [Planctomycetia bacterium]|nr:hypothetical protein [Planctomycetia bacterium]
MSNSINPYQAPRSQDQPIRTHENIRRVRSSYIGPLILLSTSLFMITTTLTAMSVGLQLEMRLDPWFWILMGIGFAVACAQMTCAFHLFRKKQ